MLVRTATNFVWFVSFVVDQLTAWQVENLPHALCLRSFLRRVGGDGQTLLAVGDRVVRIFFVLQRQRAVGGELDVAQCSEDAFHVEMAAAEDYAFRVGFLLGKVFQMD